MSFIHAFLLSYVKEPNLFGMTRQLLSSFHSKCSIPAKLPLRSKSKKEKKLAPIWRWSTAKYSMEQKSADQSVCIKGEMCGLFPSFRAERNKMARLVFQPFTILPTVLVSSQLCGCENLPPSLLQSFSDLSSCGVTMFLQGSKF